MKQLLTISQILLYYDLPQIMVCDNLVGAKFIALLIDANEKETLYVATPISTKRLSSFINGRVDLRYIYENPELKDYYTFDYNGNDVIAYSIQSDNIPKDFLPEQGFFLRKKSDDDLIIQESIEKNNAIVHIAITDSDDSNSIFADNLGDILKYYQATIENSYKKKVSIANVKDKTKYLSPINYKLRAFAVSPGSFNIHLFSNAHVDIFGSSMIDIALKKFDDFLQNGLSDEELLNVLRSVKGHTISSLKQLLNKIITLDIKIKHKWYAPDQKKVNITFIDKQKAEHITMVLESAEELTEEITRLKGYFEQVDTDHGTWRIINLEDEKEYSGTCNDNVSLQGITVDENVIYSLVCNEIIEELKVSEKQKTKLILLLLEPEK